MDQMSREEVLVFYAVCLLIGYLIISYIIRARKVLKTLIFVCAIVLLFTGGSIINLNFIPVSTKEKLSQVVNEVGDTYVRAEGGSVYVKVGSEWLNLDKVFIIGDLTRDVTILYEGEEIYLGHSGVYNTIKVLNDVGLLGGKK